VGLLCKLLFRHEAPRLDGSFIMKDQVVVLAVDDIELNLNMIQIMLGSCGDVAVV